MNEHTQVEKNDKEINVLDLVLTTKEASSKYDVADCTFRTWIKEGLFREEDIKKSGNTWLLKKEAIEAVLKEKNLYGKTFVLDGEKLHVDYLAHRGDKLQIWYENEAVRDVLDNLPHKELIPQMFEVFKKDNRINFQFVIIDDNFNENDNWLYKKEKVWAMTAKGVIDTVRDSLKVKGLDTVVLDAFISKNVGLIS
ncbi:helix-turn-helix domain-containing protein (plasmid) [Aneurinibacillus sp. Ricciae_BoGa-3]|uniref:helix-turn-helix domain-containing protein n=1 Tax=Aneurinibacillus sp. Ricciae_BoGa-3 TaxID=3022697 RepID=UPI00233FC64E|nr:helix-turn-helix domain-containing protein [Aneurinibacillus sp. Ricciae_BoGa-3]WCK57704.1 helix-turn-helix domain-containing protein [Aneurinibacillus sp. Ricciae_BoGa-3]